MIHISIYIYCIYYQLGSIIAYSSKFMSKIWWFTFYHFSHMAST